MCGSTRMLLLLPNPSSWQLMRPQGQREERDPYGISCRIGQQQDSAVVGKEMAGHSITRILRGAFLRSSVWFAELIPLCALGRRLWAECCGIDLCGMTALASFLNNGLFLTVERHC